MKLKNIIKDILIYTIFLFIFGVFVFGCRKDCNSKELSDVTFSELEHAIIPYNGNETLVFKNVNGDTIYFVGQGKIERMDKRYENPDADEQCYGDFRNVEFISVKYKCDNIDTVQYFEIATWFQDPFGKFQNLKIICYNYRKSTHTEQLDFFNSMYGFHDDTINNGSLYNDYFQSDHSIISGYYDFIVFGGKAFNNVYELTTKDGNGSALYVSVSMGIVAYKDTSGVVIYFDKII